MNVTIQLDSVLFPSFSAASKSIMFYWNIELAIKHPELPHPYLNITSPPLASHVSWCCFVAVAAETDEGSSSLPAALGGAGGAAAAAGAVASSGK